jgi:Flp pilus assembly protein TadG
MRSPLGAQSAIQTCASFPKHIGQRTGAQNSLQTLLSRFRDACHECEGSQLVEFAVVAPLLLVLILGIATLGIGLNNYITLTDAVSQGSRAFAASTGVTGTPVNGDPCAYAVSMMNSDATSLNTGNISYTITYTPTGSTTSQTFTTNTCSSIFDGMQQGDVVTVQASYPALMPQLNQQGMFLWLHLNTVSWVAHTTQVVQ